MEITPLDSPRWDELDYNIGNYASLTDELRILTDTHANQADRESAIDHITDQIFHQTSTYSGTYLSVPVLVDAIDQQEATIKFSIIMLVGLISLEKTQRPEILTDQEFHNYHQSLLLAAGKAVELFKTEEPKDTDRQIDLLVAITSLHGHPDVGWRLRHGYWEENHTCPQCNEDFSCTGGLGEKRMVRDERVKPRTKFSVTSLAGRMVNLCRRNGHPNCAQWLRTFFGTCQCPECGEPIELIAESDL